MSISITDASEEGGGAAIASKFRDEITETRAEQIATAHEKVLLGSSRCARRLRADQCKVCRDPLGVDPLSCGPSCSFVACTLECWSVHGDSTRPYMILTHGLFVCIGGPFALQCAKLFANFGLCPKWCKDGSSQDVANQRSFLDANLPDVVIVMPSHNGLPKAEPVHSSGRVFHTVKRAMQRHATLLKRLHISARFFIGLFPGEGAAGWPRELN